MTAEQVVAITLEKYNSRDSPKEYYLVIVATGAGKILILFYYY